MTSTSCVCQRLFYRFLIIIRSRGALVCACAFVTVGHVGGSRTAADDERRGLAATSLVPVSPRATHASPTIDVTIEVCDDDDGSASATAVMRLVATAEVYRVVPAGHVWLEGDNPRLSFDSRSYGPLPLRNLRGVVVARVRSPLPSATTRLRDAASSCSAIVRAVNGSYSFVPRCCATLSCIATHLSIRSCLF